MEPAATVIDAGTVADALLELSDTSAPPVGAGELRVIVHAVGEPPTTDPGLTDSVNVLTAVIVRTAIVLAPPPDAVIVELVFAVTAAVDTVKVAVIAPEATVTDAGTVVFVPLHDNTTTMPPAGAGPLSETVPLDAPPPVTVEGDRLTEATATGLIVSVADWLVVPRVPVIVALTDVETAVEAMENVPNFAPATTVTDAGTVASELSEVRPTTVPPVGAGPFSWTVPVEESPPATIAGETDRPLNEGGVTVSVAARVVIPHLALIVIGVDVESGDVLIEKLAVVAPAGMVTVAGTIALELDEDKLTTAPPDGATPFNVTTPVDVLPPTTPVGETTSFTNASASTSHMLPA